MFNLSITVLCTNKAGTLSRLIRQLKGFGFLYQNHHVEKFNEYSQIRLNYLSEKSEVDSDLKVTLAALPEVIKIIETSLDNKGHKDNTLTNVTLKNNKLNINYAITPIVIKMTERRLSRLIGPVAPFLVEKAAKSSQNIGELYLKLAKEIDEDDRENFFSVIDLEG